MTAVSEKIRPVVDGIKQKRKSGRCVSDKQVSAYRTQYLAVLRLVWKKLPCSDAVSKNCYYHCEDVGYLEVVEEVAKFVHEFLFMGLKELRFHGYENMYNIKLMDVSGMLWLCCIMNIYYYFYLKRYQRRFGKYSC